MGSREEDIQKLKRDIADVQEDMNLLLGDLRDEADNKASAWKQRLKGRIGETEGKVQGKLRDTYTTTRQAGTAVADKGRTKISGRPYMAVVGAFFVGIGTGMMLHRDRHNGYGEAE